MSTPLFETGSWLEPITFLRRGTLAYAGPGAYDPSARSWYLDAGVDVRVGDVAVFRGTTRVVVETPQAWLGAGTVVIVAEETAFPDVGQLQRATGGGFDRTLQMYVPPTGTTVWGPGPCKVSAVDAGTDDTETAEQMVTVQAFTVETPAALVDVQPDDRFVVSTSQDARLVGRPLTVSRIQAGSDGQVRSFRATDNQG